jgi:hypothetical protein
MPHRARSLVFLAFIVLSLTGCTRLPELGSFTGLLAQTDAPGPSAASDPEDELTLEHLQLKGSHNSYHQASRFSLVRGWRYSHLPLHKQLESQGVRQIELDVRYTNGKVMVGHVPFLDGGSSCSTLSTCLKHIRSWSKANRSHLPVFVFIEPKEDLAPSNLEGRLDVLDRTIASVFPREQLIIPEQVAGESPSLRHALHTRGWPTVAESRGKVVFVFFGKERHVRAYARGRPRLEGRLMFAAGEPGEPHAAITSIDNPVEDRAAIARALSEHMLVRTRADSGLKRDVHRRNVALASGAHFIGTDFVDPGTGWVELGTTAPVRCNPVLAPERCTTAALAEVEQEFWAGLEPEEALPVRVQ